MNLKVLIVEDSETDARLVVRELTKSGFAVSWERVETVATLRDALRRCAWDLVVSDSSVAKLGALRALALTRDAQPAVPFIVVSGTISEEDAVRVIRAGAANYVTKERLARLGAAVLRELRVPRDGLPVGRVSARLLAAQERERRRIARALHDELGQLLTALQLTLRSAVGRSAGVDEVIQEALSLAAQASEQARGLSLELRPAVLDDRGLVEALRWLAERHERCGLSVAIDLDAIGRLDPEIEIAAFRIVQEALTNVARHATAQRAGISLRVGDDELEIAVWDDGRGFDVAHAVERARTGETFGLAGMRESAALAGGALQLQSEAGRGAVVRVVFPQTREVGDGAGPHRPRG